MSLTSAKIRNAIDQEQLERWHCDHKTIKDCFELEDVIAAANFLFERISRFDEVVHDRLYSAASEADVNEAAADQPQVFELYKAWRSFNYLLDDIKRFESDGYKVIGSDELREALKKVAGILTSDEEFFPGDALNSLQDEALQSYRKGETTDMDRAFSA